MSITFSVLASSVANGYKIGKASYDWLTNAELKNDFVVYLSDLETRRVLYEQRQHENFQGVLASLSEILTATRTLRSIHSGNPQARSLLQQLITCMQEESDTIRGCNVSSDQGGFMAYMALIKIRTEFARVLAIFCGILDVNPKSTNMREFIINMAVVKPRA